MKSKTIAQTTSVVNDIVIHLEKTGALTPVAVIDPVDMKGIKIKEIFLHDQTVLEGLKIAVGSTIQIALTNKTIPQIIAVR